MTPEILQSILINVNCYSWAIPTLLTIFYMTQIYMQDLLTEENGLGVWCTSDLKPSLQIKRATVEDN